MKSEAEFSGCYCGVCERLFRCESCLGLFESDSPKGKCDGCKKEEV